MNTARNFILVLATIVCISIAYYFLIALPAHNRGILQLEREKFEATQEAKAKEEVEKKTKEYLKQFETEDRARSLQQCLNAADCAYWEYIKLNGTPVSGKTGTYRAPGYIWDTAQKNKKDAVDQCFREFGPR